MTAIEVSGTSELKRSLARLGRAAPATMGAFATLHGTTTADGALTTAAKELIAVAISIHDRCEPCIAYHLENALKAGASREEVLEAIGVAVMMGGGPSSVYGAVANRLLEQALEAA